MSQKKMTITRWTVMFLVSCVFALEFAMMVQGMFGENLPSGVIGTFFNILY